MIGVAADEGVLLELEDGAGDGSAGAGSPVDGGFGDFLGGDDASGGGGIGGEGFGPVGGEAVVELHLVFVFGEGPADIELIEADFF